MSSYSTTRAHLLRRDLYIFAITLEALMVPPTEPAPELEPDRESHG